MVLAEEDRCVDYGTLEDCLLEHFSKLNAKDLHEFIAAYDPNVDTKNKIKSLRKETYQLAKEALENETPVDVFNCSILAAYRCRHHPCKLDLSIIPVQDEDPAAIYAAITSVGRSIVELKLCGNDADKVSPSELLECHNWLSVSCELFNVRETVDNPLLSVDQAAKDKADLLVKYLRSRMNAFMSRRNVTKSRQGHWAIQLAYRNRAVVAAFMVLSDHVSPICNHWMRRIHYYPHKSTNSFASLHQTINKLAATCTLTRTKANSSGVGK
jgi:hypothetical protein